jgi:hypothetical protein
MYKDLVPFELLDNSAAPPMKGELCGGGGGKYSISKLNHHNM